MNNRTRQASERIRILVTGSAGMTGYHAPEAFAGYSLALTNRNTLDIRDLAAVRKKCKQFEPDVVLNLAAETDIDRCQREPKLAFSTNTLGAQNVAIACSEVNALLVHFSTTSVFPGLSEHVYSEFDAPAPIHTHGLSKLLSEQRVSQIAQRCIIVRPGWMFGGAKKDKKLVGILRRKIVEEGSTKIEGVIDTMGSPTYSLDCLILTRHLIEGGFIGTFNVVNSGYGSRFDMATVIANHYSVAVEEVYDSKYRKDAPRPASEMVHTWSLEFHGLTKYIRDWRLALSEYLSNWDANDW